MYSHRQGTVTFPGTVVPLCRRAEHHSDRVTRERDFQETSNANTDIANTAENKMF